MINLISAGLFSSQVPAENAGGGHVSRPQPLSFLPVPIPVGAPLLTLATAAQPAEAITPASAGILRQPGTRGAVRFNFCGTRCRWSVSFPLVHDANQSAGGFAQCFDWFLSLFVHDEQLSMELKAWRTQSKGIRHL